jgi:hypothetical protein
MDTQNQQKKSLKEINNQPQEQALSRVANKCHRCETNEPVSMEDAPAAWS